jgi:ABC-type sugar transport system ATPase subunit
MTPAVRVTHITKRFPGVVALNDVSFDVEAGSCHAVCGENGAGKSTLGRLLSGIDRPDAGSIEIDGQQVDFADPAQGLAGGVAMVHQELVFCENLSVEENLCLGQLPSRWTILARGAMRARAKELLRDVGCDIDPARPVNTLSIAEQQLLQIASAVGSGARIIVFDEPSSSLSEGEAEQLYTLVGRLTARGVTILYVSHRMPEIFRLTDHVTVLRDGKHVATMPTKSVDERELVRLMIGREIEQYFPTHTNTPPGEEQLRVEHLTSPGLFSDISFSLRSGEVLGLAGLVGAGRSELARALFGLEPPVAGTIYVNGRPVHISSPRKAMQLGLGLVPEDRKHQGLVLSMLARENITLPILSTLARLGIVESAAEHDLAQQYSDKLRVRTPSVDVSASSLSGGNQQKLVIARWLAAGSRILILDEPTRGVDVGAKAELHAWIDRLASDGHAILLISSELPELLNLSTRILVLRQGQIVDEVPRERATQDLLLRLMAGVDPVMRDEAAVMPDGGGV